MKQLQIMIAVLFVLKRYNHVKYTTVAVMIAVLFLLRRYNKVKYTPYETVADNNCSIICMRDKTK